MDGYRWWQTGIIYQIYPRSFMDGNGDGVGDLAGITARLDHVAALGVDAVWLSPFYPSPMADFGYDVSDHTDVDPLFGTLADIDTLIAEAHRRGLRVLVDFVPNHTSEAHPWFVAARSGRDDEHRDWYLWADPAPGGGPPNNWLAVFGGSAWTFDEATGQYYYHAYLTEQPDLNWRNPAVRQAQYDVLRFWLDHGVDGFRVDASRQLVKDDRMRDNPPNPHYREGRSPYSALLPTYTTDRPELAQLVAEMRSVVDDRLGGDGLLLGEMYLPIERLVRYYGEHGEGMQLPSNMHLISVGYRAADIADLIKRYEAALPASAWPNWVLSNHDQHRVATRIGRPAARVAAMLLLTLRGTPIVYYGDEIGMTDVPVPDELVQDPFARNVPGIGAGRDPERSPMQWSAGPNAGFCPPDTTPWLPVAADADAVNVASEHDDAGSFLSLHRALTALRRATPALTVGGYTQLRAVDNVLLYQREHQGSNALIVLNLGAEPAGIAVAGLPAGARVAVGTHPDRIGAEIGTTITLRADEGIVVTAP